MCRKVALSMPGDEANSYDASCLIVVELHESPPSAVVHPTLAPTDLGAEHFFETTMDCLLTRSQFDDHRAARRRWEAAGRGP